MRLRIAVTDYDWFRFLRSLPAVDEVNFWQPSGERAFRALIVGGGFFVRYLSLPQGKDYEPDSATARDLWEQVRTRLLASAGEVAEPVLEEEPAMWGDPLLRRQRLGQGTFRLLVTDNYGRRCAVTGEKALPVLDAAHIRPVTQGGHHDLDNGLLLRSDVHRLFDTGYVTVTPDGRFLVSRRLKDDFDNGEPYIPYNGQRIWVPGDPGSQPNRGALEWHGDAVFLG